MAIEYRSLGKSYLDSSEWPALMRKFEDYVLFLIIIRVRSILQELA